MRAMIDVPVVMLNVKAYRESMGASGMELARACERVAESTGVSVAICPQQTELALICREVEIPVLAQHAEAFEAGAHTGYVVLEAVKEAGAAGTLVNHSEHRMTVADIEAVVSRAKELGLCTVVCTSSVATSRACAVFEPDFIAVEPPELIGTGIPVSKAEPEVVRRSVEAVKEISPGTRVLCGAGISTGEDVRAALELGAEGVLLASGVVKAERPEEVLLSLAKGAV